MHRLPISLLIVVVVAIFGVGLALDTLFEKYQSESSDTLAQSRALGMGLASLLDNDDKPEALLDGWPDSQAYSLTLDSKNDLPLPPSLMTSFDAGEALALESDEGVSLHYYLPRHDKVLSIHSDVALDEPQSGIAWLFTTVFYLGTLALVLLWLKPLLHRLHLLRESTKNFGEGKLDSRINTQGITYIKDIEQDFNMMADRIQQLVEDNKLLTSAVSHDLRTPLARLRFGIDTLAEAPSDESRDQYLLRINNDLNEMESLVESLLRYARLDNVMDGIQKQDVDVRELVNECVAQYHDSNLLIKIDEPQLSSHDRLLVHGCIEHLATLFNNLISNAMTYANQQLLVEMHRNGDRISITFCDDGPGIPQAQRNQVIKPFERGTSNERKGYGLGLAVASRIAKHHQGDIKIEDCDRLGGALIVVELKSSIPLP